MKRVNTILLSGEYVHFYCHCHDVSAIVLFDFCQMSANVGNLHRISNMNRCSGVGFIVLFQISMSKDFTSGYVVITTELLLDLFPSISSPSAMVLIGVLVKHCSSDQTPGAFSRCNFLQSYACSLNVNLRPDHYPRTIVLW